MATAEELAATLRPTVAAAGLELWDVERASNLVKVTVDRPGGVDLDAISALSRALASVLDRRDDLVPRGHYVLEVSSPGVERRLRRPEHFARCIGARVAVSTTEPVGGRRRLGGTPAACDAEAISLQLAPELGASPRAPGSQGAAAPTGSEPGPAASRVRIPLRVVERARTVFDWGASLKPGSGAGLRPLASGAA